MVDSMHTRQCQGVVPMSGDARAILECEVIQ